MLYAPRFTLPWRQFCRFKCNFMFYILFKCPQVQIAWQNTATYQWGLATSLISLIAWAHTTIICYHGRQNLNMFILKCYWSQPISKSNWMCSVFTTFLQPTVVLFIFLTTNSRKINVHWVAKQVLPFSCVNRVLMMIG